MNLSSKLLVILLVLLVAISLIIIFGMPWLFSQIAERQMRKEAQTFGLFLLKNIEDIALDKNLDYSSQEAHMEELIYKEFEKAISISTETESFIVDEIILITSDYKVEVGYPREQVGQDYAGHADIVANFAEKKFNIGLERHAVQGQTEVDIDIVSYLTLNDQPRVVEIKLNFKKTTELLASQYRRFNLISVGTGFVIILILMTFLLFVIRRTAIDPVLKIADALEQVGRGNLEITMTHRTKDEFGLMSTRFNEMVTGLKEKLHLSRYVSQSTIDAVKSAVTSGDEFHKPRRKRVTVFFSDIRGFTTYSEKRDPEHIISVLNRILSLQTELINRHGGYVDKFVGDETMAIFPSPEEAVLCSLHIQSRMHKSAADFEGLQIGIGIYEGIAVEGDIGSNEVKNYTFIGDTVNTAARLQSVALGGEIVIPDFIAEKAEISSRFKHSLKGPIKLKGREQEVRLYRVTGLTKKS
ncbi:MAG: adenylate/guanylate cyclase domain-containing protein [Spirochaetales bacterium]|nr:MAG: adenylate/guanylate cyclase domain-containing protein [Spirochaetales bacterium]